jgi:dienelactone hydrolase
MSSNVKRILVKIEFENEPIRGVLFIPYGRGQFPGVIDLFGVDGGCSEFRSALFAKHGFASFALAYFGYDGLKATTFQKVELSYFDKAIKWFCNHPQVKAGRVSMIGSSLGARAALLSSFRNSQIHSTICINASHFIPSDPNIKTLQQPHMQSYEMWHGRMTHIQGNKYKCSRPVLSHKHDNPILFLVGELDLYSSSVDDVIDQLRKSGKKNVSKVTIAGQGHFIEPPYTPACTVATAFRTGTTKSNDPYMRIMDDLLQEWGGSYENNGPGQIEAWRIVLDVLRESSFSFQQNYSANFHFSKL